VDPRTPQEPPDPTAGRDPWDLRPRGSAGESPVRLTRAAADASRGPLVLVDVDGVLSLYGGEADCVGALVDGVPHLLSRAGAAVLRELAEEFECAWCTGWEERADEHLPHLLGLPRGWRHVALGRPSSSAHWKLAGIDAFAGRERPLAWIDDQLGPECEEWAADRPGPTLLVRTEPHVGLTEAHAAAVRTWARSLRP
jgi:hypothetical protein